MAYKSEWVRLGEELVKGTQIKEELVMDSTRDNKRKLKRGIVISNKMEKTLVVAVERVCRHPRYDKVISLRKKYYVHHEGAPLEVGQKVTIQETRPLSKLKRWRVVA